MDHVPTLEDIARESGFSKSTVSLALRHHHRIPEVTRHAIETIAAKLNYRPDPALTRAAANRWRRLPQESVIAFVTTNHPASNSILDIESLEGVRKRAKVFGYKIEQFRFETFGNAKRLGEVIYSRGIRGVLVGKLCQPNFSDDFPWHNFSAIACDTGFFRPPIQIVMPDRAHAVNRAWREAISRGYRRIGLVLIEEYSAVDYFDKVSAFLFNQRTVPEEDRLSICHIHPGDSSVLEAWIQMEKPDVILGFNGFVYYCLRICGYEIPKDFGFIALLGAESEPDNITRFRENLDLIGQVALEQLDILLRTNQFGLPTAISTITIESEWVSGTTLPEIPIIKAPDLTR